MKIYNNLFERILSLDNLFLAWEEFRQGKKYKSDIAEFDFYLEKNLFQLRRELKSQTYKHGPYVGFYISDPKLRHIHKASVRDRVLHHAIYSVLSPVFEPTFIPNSFSCRIGKGTHKGVLALQQMMRQESLNYTRKCFALKCDVSQFFASVDHTILLRILKRKIQDKQTIWLLEDIIRSFNNGQTNLFDRQGLPIGNLTSQLFANIYMNEFDQFMKHKLQVRHYARYTDDFVIISSDRSYLEDLLPLIQEFLKTGLALNLHPSKVSIRLCSQGVDFLGYVQFPHHRLLRAKTRQRIFRKLKERTVQYRQDIIEKKTVNGALQSYLGTLQHANAYRLSQELQNQYWFWMTE